jgi:aminobenzoyl-glutamate utilization protein B
MLEGGGLPRHRPAVAGLPTAVVGEAGEGGPVICDPRRISTRLPGLSQEAGNATEHRPVETGGHGHGCGHNLLGSAALLAAAAVKDWLAANGHPRPRALLWLPGRGGRRGQGLHGRAPAPSPTSDVAITWHLEPRGTVVNRRLLPRLHPRPTSPSRASASHAAAASPSRPLRPRRGRADAYVGVNYMREHMPSDGARALRAPRHAGGIAPNVVQAHGDDAPLDPRPRRFSEHAGSSSPA